MQASDTHDDVARADDETNLANHDSIRGLGDGDGTDGDDLSRDDAKLRSVFARDGNPREYLPGGFLGMP